MTNAEEKIREDAAKRCMEKFVEDEGLQGAKIKRVADDLGGYFAVDHPDEGMACVAWCKPGFEDVIEHLTFGQRESLLANWDVVCG